MPDDVDGEIDNHNIAVNQGDIPDGILERAKGGMRDRGGQGGPDVGGSGVHGMQDEANRQPVEREEEEEPGRRKGR